MSSPSSCNTERAWSQENGAGLTPREAAALLGQGDVVALLDEESIRRFPPKAQALMTAVRANDVTGVKAQAEEGAPLSFADEQGFTPLLWAARQGYDGIVSELLNHGADPNQLDTWMHATSGHKAAYWGHPSTMILLLQHGLNVDAQGGYNGYTALDDAVASHHREVARILIEAGARVTSKGTTAGLPSTSHAGAAIRNSCVSLPTARHRRPTDPITFHSYAGANHENCPLCLYPCRVRVDSEHLRGSATTTSCKRLVFHQPIHSGKAFKGIRKLVADTVKDMEKEHEPVPCRSPSETTLRAEGPLTSFRFSTQAFR